LSEDPNVNVCLLEAGGPDKSVLIHMPAAVVAMVPTRINNWAFKTVPQPGLNGRRGCSRAARRWEVRVRSTRCSMCAAIAGTTITGRRSATWAGRGDEVLPYFRKSEHNETHRDAYHGRAGRSTWPKFSSQRGQQAVP
jgi:choline dehydrogenase